MNQHKTDHNFPGAFSFFPSVLIGKLGNKGKWMNYLTNNDQGLIVDSISQLLAFLFAAKVVHGHISNVLNNSITLLSPTMVQTSSMSFEFWVCREFSSFTFARILKRRHCWLTIVMKAWYKTQFVSFLLFVKWKFCWSWVLCGIVFLWPLK